MFKRGKIQLIFWVFVLAVTLGVTFLVFSPPYSASFFTNLGFVILAESLILLVPVDFQSESWIVKFTFVGMGAIVYAILVAVISILGAFAVPFNWILALHLLILLIPGIGIAAAALMLKRMHSAVSDVEDSRKLFESLNTRAAMFDITLSKEGKNGFVAAFAKFYARLSTITKETYPDTEEVTRQLIAEFESLTREYSDLDENDFVQRLEVLGKIIDLRERLSRSSNARPGA